jgi:hypothetical protein
MAELKVGDSVAVYGICLVPSAGRSSGTVMDRWVGTVHRIHQGIGIEVRSHEDECVYSVHPKQCRRLVKRQKRRIWIHPDIMIRSGNEMYGRPISDEPTKGFVEFVETREKTL